MSYPWGEGSHGTTPTNWSVPVTPGGLRCIGTPGWKWEASGVAGPIPLGPPYTMAETTDTLDYFSGPHYPASAEQYRGQDRMP